MNAAGIDVRKSFWLRTGTPCSSSCMSFTSCSNWKWRKPGLLIVYVFNVFTNKSCVSLQLFMVWPYSAFCSKTWIVISNYSWVVMITRSLRGISFFPCCYSCFPFIRIDIFQKRWSVTFIKRWSLFMTQESKSSFLRYTHIHSCDFPNLECLLHHSLFWRRSRRKLAYICNLHNF